MKTLPFHGKASWEATQIDGMRLCDTGHLRKAARIDVVRRYETSCDGANKASGAVGQRFESSVAR
jgi:hypothetical protein